MSKNKKIVVKIPEGLFNDIRKTMELEGQTDISGFIAEYLKKNIKSSVTSDASEKVKQRLKNLGYIE